MAAAAPQIKTGGPGALAVERVNPGRSAVVWGNWPWLRGLEYPTIGDSRFENFQSWNGGAVASNRGNYQGDATGWTSFESSTTAASTITPTTADFPIPGTAARALGTAGAALGVITMANATSGAAHNGAIMELGGGANGASTSGPYALPPGATVTAPTAGQFPKLFFEARVRFNQTSGASAFLGFQAPGASASAIIVINASDVIQIRNAIGFAVNSVATTGFATSATKIQPYYGAASAANQVANTTNFVGNVGGIPSSADYPGGNTALVPAANAVAGVLTDFTKLGFVFDALSPDGNCLKFYQDGVLLAQQSLSQIVAANWPSDAQLTPTLVVKNTGTSTGPTSMDLDWVCWAQQITAE